MLRRFRSGLVAFAFLASSTITAAQDPGLPVTIAWDANSELLGHRVSRLHRDRAVYLLGDGRCRQCDLVHLSQRRRRSDGITSLLPHMPADRSKGRGRPRSRPSSRPRTRFHRQIRATPILCRAAALSRRTMAARLHRQNPNLRRESCWSPRRWTAAPSMLTWRARRRARPDRVPRRGWLDARRKRPLQRTGRNADVGVSATVRSGSYFARVRARTPGDSSVVSNEVGFSVGESGCAAMPKTPREVSGSIAADVATLRWKHAGGATSFIVQVGGAPGRSDLFNGNVGSTRTVSANVPAGPRSTRGSSRSTHVGRVRRQQRCGSSRRVRGRTRGQSENSLASSTHSPCGASAW